MKESLLMLFQVCMSSKATIALSNDQTKIKTTRGGIYWSVALFAHVRQHKYLHCIRKTPAIQFSMHNVENVLRLRFLNVVTDIPLYTHMPFLCRLCSLTEVYLSHLCWDFMTHFVALTETGHQMFSSQYSLHRVGSGQEKFKLSKLNVCF